MKIPFNLSKKIEFHTAAIVSIPILSLSLIMACEKNNTNYNPPADHTISQDGFMHMSGLNQPLANCVSCHGSDLKGGTTGVSCFECHKKKW